MAQISTHVLPAGVSSLTIDMDGDSAGDDSGFIALYRVIRACPDVRVRGVSRSGGADAADDLSEWVGERLALMLDGAPDVECAPMAAWKSIFLPRG